MRRNRCVTSEAEAQLQAHAAVHKASSAGRRACVGKRAHEKYSLRLCMFTYVIFRARVHFSTHGEATLERAGNVEKPLIRN